MQKNFKIVNIHCFLIILVVSPLGFNKHNQVAAMVGRNSAVGGDMIDCEFGLNGLAVSGSAPIQRQTVWRHPSWVPQGRIVS